MGFIYTIISPSRKLYVGKTYDLKKRIASHKCASKNDKTNIILHNSIKKYGWDNHLFQVIEEVESVFLNEREMFWIATLKTYCYENELGMNMTRGGDGQRASWMHDKKRRKIMSDKFTGNKNPFYGKKHTEETVKHLSKKTTEFNIKTNKRIPAWGAEKGRQICSVPVLAYDAKGAFLSEYKSLQEAATKLNLNRKNITSVLSGKQTNTCGYIFKYKTEDFSMQIEVEKLGSRKLKRPVVLLDENKNIIKEYSGASEAAKDLHLPTTTIARAAQYNDYKPIRLGHILKYKDEHYLN